VAVVVVVASPVGSGLLLGALPGPGQLAGGVLILAGIVLTRSGPTAVAADPPPVAEAVDRPVHRSDERAPG
jgi:hypothetical protein